VTGRRKERRAILTGIKAYRAEPFCPRGFLTSYVVAACADKRCSTQLHRFPIAPARSLQGHHPPNVAHRAIGCSAPEAAARVFGCPFDEGNPYPCPFLGVDLGDILYALFVSGWFALVTISCGAMLLRIWIIAAIVLFVVEPLRTRG
jgi:hypothetical protein